MKRISDRTLVVIILASFIVFSLTLHTTIAPVLYRLLTIGSLASMFIGIVVLSWRCDNRTNRKVNTKPITKIGSYPTDL